MAGLPTALDDSVLTGELLRIELRGFAQNELRREIKACLVELRPQLQEDMQACIKEAVATAPRYRQSRWRESMHSPEPSARTSAAKQLWACPSPSRPRTRSGSEPAPPPSPKNFAIAAPEGAPRMLPSLRETGSLMEATATDQTVTVTEPIPKKVTKEFSVKFQEGDDEKLPDAEPAKPACIHAGRFPKPTDRRSTGTNEDEQTMEKGASLAVSDRGSFDHTKSWAEEFTSVNSNGRRTKARNHRRLTKGKKGLTFRTYASESFSRMSRLESIMKSFSPNSYQPEHPEAGRIDKIMAYCQGLDSVIDWPVSFAIALNGLFLGVQAQYQSHNVTEVVPVVFPIFEVIFCFIFTSELLIRLLSQGRHFFYRSGWRWNWFDMTLVIMSLVEVVGILAIKQPNGEASSSNVGSVDVSFLRMLRILRALRVLRLFRLVQFIGELNMIISSITNCMRSLFWTMVLLLLMVYIMGIFFTQLVFSFRTEISRESEHKDEHTEALVYWWGSLFRSTLSLYEAILGGADWDSLVFPLAKKISVFVVPIFVLYIAFSMLAMMNVITGIFVETALKNAALDKDNEFVTLTRDIFADDIDDVGIVKRADFEEKIDQLEMNAYLKNVGIDPKDAKLMFYLLDGDKNGSLDLEALLTGMLRLRAGAKALDIAMMMSEYETQANRWRESIDELEEQVDRVVSEIDGLRSGVLANGALMTQSRGMHRTSIS